MSDQELEEGAIEKITRDGIEAKLRQVTVTYEPYEHKGCRLNIVNMVRCVFRRREKNLLEDFLEHLKQAGDAFYQGDLSTVDNFFQLYCLAKGRAGK